MTTDEERAKNLDENYPITRDFFSKVDLKHGTLKERAKLVAEFLDCHGKKGRHCCLAMPKSTIYCSSLYGDDTMLAQFENHGIEYLIFKLYPMEEIRDFKRKVLRAIDAAEDRGGSLINRKERFKHCLLPFKANFIIVGRDHGFYSWFSSDNCLWEDRGDIRYYVWIYS